MASKFVGLNNGGPPVTRDPRFKAGRVLVQTGRVTEGAVDMFATLLEEAISKHGDTSIDAASCFYEYGNALFRAANAEGTEEDDEDLLAKPELASDAAAQAAIQRLEKNQAKQQEEGTENDSKPAAAKGKEEQEDQDKSSGQAAASSSSSLNGDDGKAKQEEKEDTGESSTGSEDITLALEMMENAYSILDEAQSPSSSVDEQRKEWIQQQLPRVLQGLGDVLSALHRLPDAADAYSRALPFREVAIQSRRQQEQEQQRNNNNKEDLTLEHLKLRRQLVEANILVAEALLACPDGQDVVTTETKDLLVLAAERVDYARGYYDKARDELQETVFLMGKIAASNKDLGTEKEDVCFAATLLMGVGETLAAYDEEHSTKEPAAKKAKR